MDRADVAAAGHADGWFDGPRWETAAFAGATLGLLGGLFFRFGSAPPGVFIDEASAGYNARAIGLTLHDQWGELLPLYFRAVGDYKSPLFVYPEALTELVCGPTLLGVRLPAALYAIGTAILLALLLRRLTGRPALARWLGLLSLAVPSLYALARIGITEASAVPFYFGLALLAAWRFQERPTTRDAIGLGVAFSLCFYSYATCRLLAPVWLLCACAAFSQPRYRPHLLAIVASGAAMAMPALIFMSRHPGALTQRFDKDVSIFVDQPSLGVALGRFASTYVDHLLSFDFLFHTGQHFEPYNPGEGFLPLWLFAPLVLAPFALWKRREQPLARLLAAMWITSPLAVALTWNNLPHTGRFLHFAPLALLVGGLALADWIEVAQPRRAVLATLVGVALFEAALTYSLYFGDYLRGEVSHQGLDDGQDAALRVAFAARRPGERLYLPGRAFDFDAVAVAFAADLPPAQYRSWLQVRGGARDIGINGLTAEMRNAQTFPPGVLVVWPGPFGPRDDLELVPMGEALTRWTVFHTRAP